MNCTPISLVLQLCMNLIQIYLISKQNSIHLLLNAGAICVQYSLADVTGNVGQLFMCNWNLSYNIHVQLLGSMWGERY